MPFEPPEIPDELLANIVASLGVDDPVCAARLAQRLRDFGRAYAYGRVIHRPLRSYAASRAATKKIALLSERLIEALTNLDVDVEIALAITSSELRTKAVNKTIGVPSIDALRHLQAVASYVAERLPKRTGRPNDRMLELGVGAMMAAIERATGQRASVTQKCGSDYSPSLRSPEAKAIAAICQAVDPELRDTKLINVIADLGKRYQGKPMDEAEFLPLVGAPVYGVRARQED